MAKKTKSIKKDSFNTKRYLDKALKEHSAAIIKAVDFGFEKNRREHEIFESEIDFIFKENKKEHETFEDKIDKLANTLDKFLKHLMDLNDEFKIVKARLTKVEKILEEKLGVVIN